MNECHNTPSKEPYINSYVENLKQDIKKEILQGHRENLNRRERAALKRLSNNRDIIIKSVDKGGATVILNTNNYISEAMRQLNNEEYYKKVEKDLTSDHEQLINQCVDELINIKDLGKRQVSFLDL